MLKDSFREPNSKFYAVLRVLLSATLIFIVSQVVAVFLVELAINFTKSDTSLNSSTIAEFFYVLLAEGLAAGFVLMLIKKGRADINKIGLGRWPNLNDLKISLIAFFIFYVLLIISSALITLVYPDLDKGTQDVGFNNLKGIVDTVLAFAALVIFPPIGEEILVRGYLYSGLRSRLKYLPALIITSLLFGVAHLQSGSAGVLWAAGVNTFILSAVLVYLRESSGALYAGMLLHALNNLIAFGFHFRF